LLSFAEEPTISYWKELAENRRQALEEALRENEALHSRIAELEKDNSELEEMVQEAKAIAEVVSVIPYVKLNFTLNILILNYH